MWRSPGVLADPQSSTSQQLQGILSTPRTPSSRPSHRIRLVPALLPSRSEFCFFEPITRDVREGDPPLNIGRITRHYIANGPGSKDIAFKSKVVSRAHAEIWAIRGGKVFIRDTKSSSGTFLNYSRLSPPNINSGPFELKDGDILQLGVTYQGGAEDIYKCVTIMVEMSSESQFTANMPKFVFISTVPSFC